METESVQMNRLIKDYISRFSGLGAQSAVGTIENGWEIKTSKISNRGVFSTRDYEIGDVIFVDAPLVYGPRAASICGPVCVVCYKSRNLKGCSRGCGLPVCSAACEDGQIHRFECQFLRDRFAPSHIDEFRHFDDSADWSSDLMKAVTPIRSLNLDIDGKQIIANLHRIAGRQQSFEVNLLKKYINNGLLSKEEEYFMRLCCCVLDANAYEISAATFEDKDDDAGDRLVNLRGLFPLASVMNHSCSPNTMHVFGSKYQMIVKATKYIPKNTELTTTYCSLLLATPARRLFLAKTKHFLCECSRCQDPTEFGTNLSALRCCAENCSGILLPTDSLNFLTVWTCSQCKVTLNSNKVAVLQTILANRLKTLDLNNPLEIIQYLQNSYTPQCNHIHIELELSLIHILGHKEGFQWRELTDANLRLKKDICDKIVEIIKSLHLGSCRLRGMCLFELYLTIEEMRRREMSSTNIQMRDTLTEAASIYEHDSSAPETIRTLLKNRRKEFSSPLH